jgi:hypothetical protein
MDIRVTDAPVEDVESDIVRTEFATLEGEWF